MKVFNLILLCFCAAFASAQDRTPKNIKPFSNKFTLGTDLVQPFFLGGFNINATYTTNNFIFDWSHGVGLSLPDNILTDEQEALDAEIEIVWTTGPGVGYRLTKNLDARVDFKIHRNEVDLLKGEQFLDYNSYTAGPGVFYRFYLGKNTGFGLELSVRYWFELGNELDNLDGSDFEFTDSNGNSRSFDTNINGGIGANIALIYTFGKNK